MSKFTTFSKSALPVLLMTLSVSCASRPHMTIENLKESATAELRASVKYQVFSEQALDEGYSNISNFFKALSSSSKIHVDHQMNILKSLRVDYQPKAVNPEELHVGMTTENLQLVLEKEEFNFLTRFRVFATVAIDEGCSIAEEVFSSLGKGSQGIVRYAERALQVLEREQSDWNVVNSWSVCPKCGGVYITVSLDENCAYCKTAASAFGQFQ